MALKKRKKNKTRGKIKKKLRKPFFFSVFFAPMISIVILFICTKGGSLKQCKLKAI